MSDRRRRSRSSGAFSPVGCRLRGLRRPDAARAATVVATLLDPGDFVRNVGGDRVERVDPCRPGWRRACLRAHARPMRDGWPKRQDRFRQRPEFEGWISRLVKSSGTRRRSIEAGEGCQAAERRGGRPHGARPRVSIRTPGRTSPTPSSTWRLSATRLSRPIPPARRSMRRTRAAYLAKLDALDAEVRAPVDSIPPDRRRIITSHDAFGYFEAAYGLRVHRPAGRLDRRRSLGPGRGEDHPADQGARRSRPCSGECLRSRG